MTAWPPPYPRVPHLTVSSAVARDDLVLSSAEREELLSGPVVVEEKLDGANVMLWIDAAGLLRAATRGGVGAMDRGGQLGPLRAWIGPRSDQLRELLRAGRVLYGEWLWKRHTVRYAHLRDWLVGFDILEGSGDWLEVDSRNRALVEAGLQPPPMICGSATRELSALIELAGRSSLGDELAEGIIVRRAPGSTSRFRLAKMVFRTFQRLTDDRWAQQRQGNELAPLGNA